MKSLFYFFAGWISFYYGISYLLTPNYKVHKDGVILITGASSGIGQDAAFALADLGFDVFASVRKQDDADRLKKAYKERNALNSDKFHPFIMDVSTESHIQRGFAELEEFLKHTNKSLIGIVNNAGIGGTAPTEFANWHWNSRILNVNLLGTMSVTQHAIPHLRKNQGRIVSVGSLAGLVSLGYDGAYTASKHAVEGLTDCWRRELYGMGVSVSLIEPGFVKTLIMDKQIENTPEKLLGINPEQMQIYQHYLNMRERGKVEMNGAVGPELTTTPHIVHALTATHPHTRYQQGNAGPYPATIVPFLASILPDRLVDVLIYYF